MDIESNHIMSFGKKDEKLYTTITILQHYSDIPPFFIF
jgi:hypothetical protein